MSLEPTGQCMEDGPGSPLSDLALRAVAVDKTRDKIVYVLELL